MKFGACRMRQCSAYPCLGRLPPGSCGEPSALPSPPPGPNPTGTSQRDPTPSETGEAARVGAGGNGTGRKESPRSPTGYLGVPAAREPSSPAAGLGSCRRGEQDELRAGSAVKVQPDSPRKLPRHGPAPPPPGLPGTRGGAPAHPGAAPLPTLPAATSALPSRDPPVPRGGTRALLSGEKHPSSLPPLRLQETSPLPPAGREN